MKYEVFEHDGRKHQIDVVQGKFTTVIDGESITADTYDKLKQKITRLGRRKTIKLALPATLARANRRYDNDGFKLIDVNITGIHLRNRNVLYRTVSDGKAGDVEYSDKLMVRLDAKQHAHFKGLYTAKQAAIAAYEKFIETHEYSTHEVAKQVAAAEQAAGLEPEED
jgi:hypothetical protein